MTSTDENLFNLLLRIRTAILNGDLRIDNSFDLEFSKFTEENIAIQLLETRGMLKTSRLFFKVMTGGELSVDNSVKFDEKVTLSNLNLEVYEKICEELGINPYAETLHATIKLLNFVTPVVVIGKQKFTLPTLRDGNATDIIRIAYKNADQTVDRDELKMLTGITTLNNVKDMIRATPFSPSGALAPFMSSSPSAITLNSRVELDLNQLNKIRKAAD